MPKTQPRPAPQRQGDLDAMCGIYSIVNCMQLMVPDYDASVGFRALYRLSAKHCPHIAIRGSKPHQLQIMLTCYLGNLRRRGTKVRFALLSQHRAETLHQLWACMMAHHRQYGPGSILIGLGGQYEHWTSVCQITDTVITFADSGVCAEVERSEATRCRPTISRPHQLDPEHIYLFAPVR